MSITEKTTGQAKLAEAMRQMLSVSCEAFGRITGLAKVALYALESPDGVRDVDAMAELLGSIAELSGLASDAVQNEVSRYDIEPDLAAWNRRDDVRGWPCSPWICVPEATPHWGGLYTYSARPTPTMPICLPIAGPIA